MWDTSVNTIVRGTVIHSHHCISAERGFGQHKLNGHLDFLYFELFHYLMHCVAYKCTATINVGYLLVLRSWMICDTVSAEILQGHV